MPQGIVHGPAALHERLDGRYDEIRHGQVFRVVFSRYVTFSLCNIAVNFRILRRISIATNHLLWNTHLRVKIYIE